MAIDVYDEKFTLTSPDGSVVEILRAGECIEWTGFVSATDRRGNGIGGSECWSQASVAALRQALELADEEGYRLTGYDGQPDYEDVEDDEPEDGE